MAEETIWTGTSSQLKNFGAYFASGLAAILVIGASIYFQMLLILTALPLPLCYAAYRFLKISSRQYKLTSERLLITEGILSKATDSLELYRVKDLRMMQPVLFRFFGLENVELFTSDKTNADIVLDGVPQRDGLADKCRTYIEACRQRKGTREIELE